MHSEVFIQIFHLDLLYCALLATQWVSPLPSPLLSKWPEGENRCKTQELSTEATQNPRIEVEGLNERQD